MQLGTRHHTGAPGTQLTEPDRPHLGADEFLDGMTDGLEQTPHDVIASFEQLAPLGDLTIRWTGSDVGDVDVRDEYDDHDEAATSTEDVDRGEAEETQA